MILESFRLEGKVAIITGAGRGLGRAMAIRFANCGADIVAASRTVAQLEETAARSAQARPPMPRRADRRHRAPRRSTRWSTRRSRSSARSTYWSTTPGIGEESFGKRDRENHRRGLASRDRHQSVEPILLRARRDSAHGRSASAARSSTSLRVMACVAENITICMHARRARSCS